MELETLINNYAKNKIALDELKKEVDVANAEIKKQMKLKNLTRLNAGEYTATYSVSERESWDEQSLINMLKLWEVNGVIKTKEYVDVDALEEVIYKGTLNEDQLWAIDRCKTTKKVITLRVNKSKEDVDDGIESESN